MTDYTSSVRAADFHPETRSFFAGRRVAVTGGSGFIGSHVVEQLLELEAHPIVLSRQPDPRFVRHLGARIDRRVADLENFDDTRRALTDASTVISAAGSVAGLEYNARHPASIFQANLQAFFNTIRAAQLAGAERFCVVSSACVYPRFCSIPTPESEGFVGEPEPTNSGYGWAKRMQEFLGAKYAEEFGLSVAIARPYNAYGPRDNFDPASSHVIPALILKANQTPSGGTFRVWGDGTHSRSFLYVDDFARGVLEIAARHPTGEALNVGTDEETTIADVARLVASYVSELRGVEVAPTFDAHGLTGQPRRRCDTSRLESVLGFRARVPFEVGLRKTVEWFLSDEDRPLPPHP